ncbi:MAG TPA: helix-turn-helix domain-containing protein, partial [Ignavibacteriaceae bacterium]|nr:helix-turn-helix domain-containing protein [Ignavibacteriaceae bacterium]
MTEQKSQCQMLLEHLQAGRSITYLEASIKYGVAHLPRRIKDLEERGYKIIRETIEVEKSNGKKAFVTKYSFSIENFKR